MVITLTECYPNKEDQRLSMSCVCINSNWGVYDKRRNVWICSADCSVFYYFRKIFYECVELKPDYVVVLK